MQTHERETAHGRITEGGGGKESGPPPPKNSPKIGFLSILVRFPFKSQSYQVNISCWVINQRNANLTVFRWQANDGPLLWCLDPLSHHQLKKRCQSWTPPLPRTKFSGWVVMFYVRSQGDHVLTTTAVALILDIMLSLRLCLRPTIIADSLGPDQAQQNVMFLLIRLCGAQADATSLVSYNKVGIHTSIDVW